LPNQWHQSTEGITTQENNATLAVFSWMLYWHKAQHGKMICGPGLMDGGGGGGSGSPRSIAA